MITTVVMDIIAVVCSFFLRSESSKAVIADRKEVQILAIFKNKKAFLFVISLAIFSIAWLLINFFYVVKLENCGFAGRMHVIDHFELFSRTDAGRTHFRKIV